MIVSQEKSSIFLENFRVLQWNTNERALARIKFLINVVSGPLLPLAPFLPQKGSFFGGSLQIEKYFFLRVVCT